MQKYYQQFDTCRERDIPACADVCPFKMDILTIQDRIAGGRFNAAYKSIRDCVVFPGIVSELCPAYCENVCVRKTVDTPVQLRLLEKSAIANATRKTPNKYNLPARKQRVAVIGAGISGMGFAFRMASKKYGVTVFEKSSKIGGHLAELMDEAAYMAEFELQFKNEKYSLVTDSDISDLHNMCRDSSAADADDRFDVIYVATGRNGSTFGVPLPDADGNGGFMMIGDTAVFIGGEVCGKDLMHALADSINISTAAEGFLKTKKIEYPGEAAPTGCVPDLQALKASPAIVPAGPALTEDECIAEASRCIRCQCNACATHCDLVAYYDKMPAKMRDEIFLSCKPAGSLVHKSPARKYVAACTMCELMEEACPEHIDLCGMVKYARHKMHEADKVPAAYRQYFMRDMEFANGEYAAVKRTAPADAGCCSSCSTASDSGNAADVDGGYAFFPGCNLGALDPEYVIKPYKWLLSRRPDTSLLLRCCSIPVDWNGDSSLHNEEIAGLKQDWEDLGKPTLIMACISCQKHLGEYLPEIPTVSLYEILEKWGFGSSNGVEVTEESESFAIFDPCSARNNSAVQKSVRNLLTASDIPSEELPEGSSHGCCGFGGMGSIAAPDFAEYVARQRIELSDSPYIVYCSNCRDIFCDRGKKAVHILDVLFAIDPECCRPQPDVTQRRRNRVELKKRLLEEIWKEVPEMKSYESELTLIMQDDVREKVNKQHLLEEDICAVISNAETTGRRAFDPATGHYKAYREIGHITCWVEYCPDASEDGCFEIFNTYTHRMKIELEAVWNGRKTETDM
ncbi:MAG: NAD(P)-binding protein [Bacillota bacterium]|nr:NAD(P)-binding protein [Bacillota bacterium]